MNWNSIESELFGGKKFEKCFKRDFRGARVYIFENEVLKVQSKSKNFSEADSFQELCSEYKILLNVKGLKSFIQVVSFVDDDNYAVLALKKSKGIPLPYVKINSFFLLCNLIFQMLSIVIQLTKKNISHGDLALHNFILGSDNNLVLLDFGMSNMQSKTTCIGLNLFKRFPGNFPILGSIIRLIEFYLPENISKYYRRVFGIKPYNFSNLDE